MENDEFDKSLPDPKTYYDSTMRIATETPMESRAQRRKSRHDRIIQRRGVFKWLPVYFSNDLVNGSWWFVAGSIIAMLIPVVPLVDLFDPFWPSSISSLPVLQDAATFGLLIISGLFFTLGSYAFVRATEEPPVKPLFTWKHVATDELLAAWLFLFGTIPFPAFIGVYLYYNPHVYAYWGAFFISLILLLATYFFVLACYPTDSVRQQIVPQCVSCFPKNSCVHKHLSNDWLAGTWIFFFGTLVLFVGSAVMLYLSLVSDEFNPMELFDWITSTLDAFVFLVGSAYFCAGSYPPDPDYIPSIVREHTEKFAGLDDVGYGQGFSSSLPPSGAVHRERNSPPTDDLTPDDEERQPLLKRDSNPSAYGLNPITASNKDHNV